MLQADIKMQQSFDRLQKVMRDLRKSFNLTQVDVAKLCGITSTAVAYIERGRRLPRLDTLCVLLELYGRSLEWLAHELDL